MKHGLLIWLTRMIKKFQRIKDKFVILDNFSKHLWAIPLKKI